MIVLDLSILNQKGTPMFNSDLTANRPAAGIVGRIFIATDSPYGIFRDTGTAWDQISSAGGGATIYTGDGTLSGNRTISSGGFNLSISPQTTFSSSLTAATGGSSYSVLGSNTLSYAVGFSSSNIGNVYGANGAINLQNFLGNATFAQANLASAMVSVNSIDFGSGGHTITMTQSTGIRAMTGHQSQIQFQGSHNGTISHAAISQNLGFYRAVGSTRTLTITNAYSLLLNNLDDYGGGFTFTNRWGIYQAGSSDNNYFAGSLGIGHIGTGSNYNLRIERRLSGSTFFQSIVSGGSVQSDVTNTASYFYTNVSVANSVFTLNNLVHYNAIAGSFGASSTVTNQYGFSVDSGLTNATNNYGFYGSINNGTNRWNLYLTGADNYIGSKLLIGTTTVSTFMLDVSGTTRLQSKLSLSAGTISNAQINFANSANPTTPNNGDVWFDGTNLFMRIGGVTKTFTII